MADLSHQLKFDSNLEGICKYAELFSLSVEIEDTENSMATTRLLKLHTLKNTFLQCSR